jgi:choline dehydrogenase-like flavoprotein
MTPAIQEFDAIVVGTGPGGATLSKELSQSGKKVLMLEWGNNNPVKGTALQGASQLLVPGKSLLLTNGMMSVARGITTGGSSLFYCATAFHPPVDMFKAYGIDITREIEEVKADVPGGPNGTAACLSRMPSRRGRF